MANPPLHIPDLSGKLEVLYRHSKNIVDHRALGSMFASGDDPGVSERTVRNWLHGAGTMDKNTLPGSREKRFVEIVRDQLPGTRTLAETEALLVRGSAADLLAAFIGTSDRALFSRVLLDAPSGRVRLLRQQTDALRITTRQKTSATEGDVERQPVREAFQLEYTALQAGWMVAVQCSRGGFFAVDLEEGRATCQLVAGTAILPLDDTLFEEDEPSRRRYLFLNTASPLPDDLSSALDASASAEIPMAITDLDRIAQLANTMPGSSWASLDVVFFAPT